MANLLPSFAVYHGKSSMTVLPDEPGSPLEKEPRERKGMMATCAIPVIDPDVKYVGVSKLRDMNASKLKDSHETTYVLQENDQPLAVLLSFEKYQIIQQELNGLMNALELLQNKEEREGVMAGLRDIAEGKTRSIAEVRASLKTNGPTT